MDVRKFEMSECCINAAAACMILEKVQKVVHDGELRRVWTKSDELSKCVHGEENFLRNYLISLPVKNVLILCNWTFQYCVHNSLPMLPVLSQLSPFNTSLPAFRNHFNFLVL